MSDDNESDMYGGRTVIAPNQGTGSPSATGRPIGEPVSPHSDRAPSVNRTISLEAVLSARDATDIRNSNPVMTAAGPILMLLGRLRLLRIETQAEPLLEHLAQAVVNFERALFDAGVDQDQVRIAKFALCATADDVRQNLSAFDRLEPDQKPLLARFFRSRASASGFFDELSEMRREPVRYADLLELMHTCLCLGFEGPYRNTPDGLVELARVRRDTYLALRQFRAGPDAGFAPNWRGLDLPDTDHDSRVPVWAFASFAAFGMLGLFILLRSLLAGESNTLAATLVSLHPGSRIGLEQNLVDAAHRSPTALKTAQLDRIRVALAPLINDGAAIVGPVGDQIVIRISNRVVFASGAGTIQKRFEPVVRRLAGALEQQTGPIRVIGHTDDLAPRFSWRYASGFELSQVRAEALGKAIGPYLSDVSRLTISARGGDQPVARSNTEEGRSLNRRIEIMISRSDT